MIGWLVLLFRGRRASAVTPGGIFGRTERPRTFSAAGRPRTFSRGHPGRAP